ncbi:hypothetical protein H6P81_002429 [Aristolochia fimbriata]|uniref:Amine oxidase domain-containing protein n=1 Tax=Aristolochia fimbriata TaxID=158543 RepID=A0AAV7FDK5_ARIFI|nr:hypothetical protein H6P81_002429 [Aristolochia fimbriata]
MNQRKKSPVSLLISPLGYHETPFTAGHLKPRRPSGSPLCTIHRSNRDSFRLGVIGLEESQVRVNYPSASSASGSISVGRDSTSAGTLCPSIPFPSLAPLQCSYAFDVDHTETWPLTTFNVDFTILDTTAHLSAGPVLYPSRSTSRSFTGEKPSGTRGQEETHGGDLSAINRGLPATPSLSQLLHTESFAAHSASSRSPPLVMDTFTGSSVIVIGAGISGISAAKVLAENGVEDLVILEATDRIGGRIRKEEFGDLFVEIGAGWIQGVGGKESNPVWDLAAKSGLRTCYSDYSNARFNIYDRSGKIFPSNLATDSYNRAVENAIRELRNQEAKLHGVSAESEPSSTPSSPIELAIDFILHDFEMAEVEPIATYTDLGEREFLVADERGYDMLLHKMAEGFLISKDGKIVDDRLKLNKVVREVHYSRNCVTVRTEDDCIYNAKYLILSVSLGVLQSDLITFSPSLPKWKTEAISKLDVIVYTKIFLKFPYKFWPSGPGTEFFLYAHEKRGFYTFWQHMENAYPDSNILVVTLTNEESKRVESQSDEETMKEAISCLRDMFGPNIPDASHILVPKWWNNRFQRGSYSNYPMFATQHDFTDVKAPVGPIFFSGEHTSERFNGYVHGGYLSGIDTSKALLEETRKEKEEKSDSGLFLLEPLLASLNLTTQEAVSGLDKWADARELFLNGKLVVQEAIK